MSSVGPGNRGTNPWLLGRELNHRTCNRALANASEIGGCMKGLWRRVRDLNPRYPFRYVGFQDRCNQPLCQLSVIAIIRQSAITRLARTPSSPAPVPPPPIPIGRPAPLTLPSRVSACTRSAARCSLSPQRSGRNPLWHKPSPSQQSPQKSRTAFRPFSLPLLP